MSKDITNRKVNLKPFKSPINPQKGAPIIAAIVIEMAQEAR